MTRMEPSVKTNLSRRCLDWIDAHPRTGWYNACVVTLILLMQIAESVHLLPF